MSVRLINNNYILLESGDQKIVPTAEEIYSIIFEGQSTIRNIPVTDTELAALGLEFSKFTADPFIILETVISKEPIISCSLVAREGTNEAEVSVGPDGLLDYAIASGRWLPLPIGSLGTVEKILTTAGMTHFGPISIRMYITLLEQQNPVITIQDRTEHSLAASQLATTLIIAPPTGLNGNLYPYQLDGYRWLSYINRNGLGAIIGDEMGLGKTLQVICLLLEVVGQGQLPNLVICPATLLENWRRELNRFGPGLGVYIHTGSRRTGFPNILRSQDVVICSFDTAVMDVSLMKNINWNVLVVDEAQGIKNPVTKRSVQIKKIPRKCAIAMTGTPVENHLTDLWSIIDFVLPSMLGSLSDFERRHPDTIAGAQLLEPTISPLMLRRMVTQVAKDLPERIDIPQALELDDVSAHVYESIREKNATDGNAPNLSALIHLRMFCTHPWLTNHFSEILSPSACSVKFTRLLEIVDEIALDGGKVLIFTSFQRSIDLIVSELPHIGIPADFIDGRVPLYQRQQKVDEFTAHKGPAALVLNPKAAGVGLNITAANHVIHYNLEWNPAVEDQATARAYRRGQNRVVMVHRLFYINTIEDVINTRMDRKRGIAAAAVIGTDGRQQEIDDILRALRISPINSNMWRS